jgi:serine/threonine protein kinase
LACFTFVSAALDGHEYVGRIALAGFGTQHYCRLLLLCCVFPGLRYLGGGAFGEVYLCRWHGVEVAVKSLSPSLISNDCSGTPCADACADLLKEAAVLASLHHPNIVSVFGVVLPPWQLLSSRSRTTSADLAGSLQQQQQGSTAEQLAAAADELTDELLAAAAGTSISSSAPGAGSSAAVSFSGCRAAMASALSQGHPPAPAIVTEFLSLGSLHSAINCRAEWLRGSMARAKLLLDTARVSAGSLWRVA